MRFLAFIVIAITLAPVAGAEDAEARRIRWIDQAEAANQEYLSGRMDEAIKASKDALKIDPQNIVAQTLLGLAAYDKANLPLAKQTFAAMLKADPSNLMALHNLAVISFESNDADSGLRYYIRAMKLNMENRLLLDNIAQALETYPKKHDTLYLSLRGLAIKPEAALEARMVQDHNLYRWGASWASKEQLALLQQQLQSIRKQMTELDQTYRQHVKELDQAQASREVANDRYKHYYGHWWVAEIDEEPTARALKDEASQAVEEYDTSISEKQKGIEEDKKLAEKLKKQYAAMHQAQYPGRQRLMRLGEDVDPPQVTPVTIEPLPE